MERRGSLWEGAYVQRGDTEGLGGEQIMKGRGEIVENWKLEFPFFKKFENWKLQFPISGVTATRRMSYSG